MTLKRSLIGAAAIALLGTFIFGRESISYFRTGFRNVRDVVKAEVPIEFEIERARTLVDQLVPDIRKCVHVIAEQQVDVEYRQAALAQKETALVKQKDAILAARNDLSGSKSSFVYASTSYSKDDVKRDLAIRFERFKTAGEMLAADRTILQARKQTLVANTEKLDDMMKAKKDLEVKLEQLQARLQTVRAAESVSELSVDDSNLSHARELITELNKQLDVKQKKLDTEAKFADLIPIEKSSVEVPTDLDQQIDAYFSSSGDPGAVANSK